MVMCEEKILLTQKFVLLHEEHDEGDNGYSTADNLLHNAAKSIGRMKTGYAKIIAKLYSFFHSYNIGNLL